jgi:hypothetical protein
MTKPSDAGMREVIRVACATDKPKGKKGKDKGKKK